MRDNEIVDEGFAMLSLLQFCFLPGWKIRSKNLRLFAKEVRPLPQLESLSLYFDIDA